jgi:hypothetical protein
MTVRAADESAIAASQRFDTRSDHEKIGAHTADRKSSATGDVGGTVLPIDFSGHEIMLQSHAMVIRDHKMPKVVLR